MRASPHQVLAASRRSPAAAPLLVASLCSVACVALPDPGDRLVSDRAPPTPPARYAPERMAPLRGVDPGAFARRSPSTAAPSSPYRGGAPAAPPAPLPAGVTLDKTCVACSMTCGDDDACTFDARLGTGDCGHFGYGPSCVVAAACSLPIRCDGDYCRGVAAACADADPCTADVCDPFLRRCEHVPIPGCAGSDCVHNGHCEADEFCAPTGRCAPRRPPFQELGPVRAKRRGSTRVMTYNTLYGFAPRPGYHPQRGQLAATWLAAMQPDVLALQELVGWERADLAAAAAGWGHGYVEIADQQFYKIGLTASRPLLDCAFDRKSATFGVLSCRIDNVVYVAVHLRPGFLQARRAEGRAVGALVQAHTSAGRGVVVLGDLNSLAPVDELVYGLQDPRQWFFASAADAAPGDGLGTDVVARLLRAGLIDMQAWWRQNPLVGSTLPAGNPPWGVRIDYILATPDIVVRSIACWVADAPQRTTWSDHLPVVMDIVGM